MESGSPGAAMRLPIGPRDVVSQKKEMMRCGSNVKQVKPLR